MKNKTVYLEEENIQDVQRMADTLERSFSKIINIIIADYFKKKS